MEIIVSIQNNPEIDSERLTEIYEGRIYSWSYKLSTGGFMITIIHFLRTLTALVMHSTFRSYSSQIQLIRTTSALNCSD